MKRGLLAGLVAVLVGQYSVAPVTARQSGPLAFFKNIFVTGDYAVGGVGLRGTGVGGIASGDILISGVPTNADVLGAFLYWQTVVASNSATDATIGVTFNGHTIGGVTDASGTIATPLNPGGSTPCWSAGGAAGSANGSKKLLVFRADVLRYITELRADGRLAVNAADRVTTANPSGGFRVQMPDGGNGGSVPLTLGASLVVIYRDPSLPLRAITMYDGAFTMDQGNDSFALEMRGFHQAVGPTARLTAIVGDGQANFSERVRINGVNAAGYTLDNGPFRGPDWDNVTFTGGVAGPGIDFTMPTTSDSNAVMFAVDRVGLSSYDCLSFAATVFSAPVRDTDNDGLLDVWEDADTTTLSDPRGVTVPNLYAMGARPNQRDVFFEVNYLTSKADGSCTNAATLADHCHRPSKAVVDRVAQAYMNGGVMPHFDMGTAAEYHTTPPASWIIPTGMARGGNAIPEETCTAEDVECAFPGVPGVIGWKMGFQKLRDEVISPSAAAGLQERFDSNRRDSFRYALFAHALGLESSVPGVPTKTSGIADPPGGDLMVTLGLWDDFIATPFMQASTWLHESGHNAGLRHGGNSAAEPNCKPNYQSVMNYLFQTRGLICHSGATAATAPACVGAGMAGQPVIDFSRQLLPSLDELALTETPGLGTGTGAMAYRTRWYSPVSFVDDALDTTAPTKRCDGGPILGSPQYRIDGTTVSTSTIDWYADGLPTTGIGGSFPQDITFSTGSTTLNGSNDWATIDLRHVGSRRNVAGLSIGVTDADLGKGDLGKGDLGKGDLGKGDLGKGDLGKGDLGKGDLGKGDLGDTPPGSPPGDLDLETARHIGNAPDLHAPVVNKQSITLSWTGPHVDASLVSTYTVFRITGSVVNETTLATRIIVTGAAVPGTTLTIVDTSVKNNTTYTYFMVADFTNASRSGVSNFQTVLKK